MVLGVMILLKLKKVNRPSFGQLCIGYNIINRILILLIVYLRKTSDNSGHSVNVLLPKSGSYYGT